MKTERETDIFHLLVHSPDIHMAMDGWSKEVHLGILPGWQEPNYFSHLPLLFLGYDQEVEFEVEQLGLEPTATLDAGITKHGFTHYTKTMAPRLILNT